MSRILRAYTSGISAVVEFDDPTTVRTMAIGIPAGGNGRASASERSAEPSRIRQGERILAYLLIPTEDDSAFLDCCKQIPFSESSIGVRNENLVTPRSFEDQPACACRGGGSRNGPHRRCNPGRRGGDGPGCRQRPAQIVHVGRRTRASAAGFRLAIPPWKCQRPGEGLCLWEWKDRKLPEDGELSSRRFPRFRRCRLASRGSASRLGGRVAVRKRPCACQQGVLPVGSELPGHERRLVPPCFRDLRCGHGQANHH